jgi:hypothetical protein
MRPLIPSSILDRNRARRYVIYNRAEKGLAVEEDCEFFTKFMPLFSWLEVHKGTSRTGHSKSQSY